MAWITLLKARRTRFIWENIIKNYTGRTLPAYRAKKYSVNIQKIKSGAKEGTAV